MKPPFLLLSFAASFAALLALPANSALAITPVLVTGVLLIMATDYRRPRRLLTCPVAVRKSAERLRLAA